MALSDQTVVALDLATHDRTVVRADEFEAARMAPQVIESARRIADQHERAWAEGRIID
jgi:hypothetical protein